MLLSSELFGPVLLATSDAFEMLLVPGALVDCGLRFRAPGHGWCYQDAGLDLHSRFNLIRPVLLENPFVKDSLVS